MGLFPTRTKFIRIALLLMLLTSIALIDSFNSMSAALAESGKNFEIFMSQWEEKKEIASQYLLRAEEAFEEGDELSACAIQREASEYGMEATQSLIYAMEANGTTDSIDNLKAGMNKWKEIGEVCGPILN